MYSALARARLLQQLAHATQPADVEDQVGHRPRKRHALHKARLTAHVPQLPAVERELAAAVRDYDACDRQEEARQWVGLQLRVQ